MTLRSSETEFVDASLAGQEVVYRRSGLRGFGYCPRSFVLCFSRCFLGVSFRNNDSVFLGVVGHCHCWRLDSPDLGTKVPEVWRSRVRSTEEVTSSLVCVSSR